MLTQQQRMVHAAEEIRRLPEARQFYALMEFVGNADPARREMAASVLTEFGAPAVAVLLTEAVLQRHRPRHCARLLEIVERINEPLSVMSMADIAELLTDGHGRVREAAARVLVLLGHAP